MVTGSHRVRPNTSRRVRTLGSVTSDDASGCFVGLRLPLSCSRSQRLKSERGDAFVVGSWVYALKALAGKLTEAQTQQALDAVLQLMTTTDPNALLSPIVDLV